MLRSMKFLSLAFVLVPVLLSGCNDAPAPSMPTKLSYSSMPQYHFKVSNIDIVEDYVPPMKAPNVEHLFPIPPAEGAKIWVNDRLKADGGEYRMEADITDASVVEVSLPKTEGIKGTFTVDQSTRYDGKLNVVLKVYGPTKLLPEATTEVSASRSRTIAENASLEEREKLFNQMTQELVDVLNSQMEKNLTNYLGQYMTN